MALNISKFDAAIAQLKTAIRLYFENGDPISVHTLAMASSEIIERICAAKGVESMRANLLANIRTERRKEVIGAYNKARNFFKHAAEGNPDEILEDFDDDRNLFALVFATSDLNQLGINIEEARMFGVWVSIVVPELVVNAPDAALVAIFGDIATQPRAEQKKIGHDAIYFHMHGKLP